MALKLEFINVIVPVKTIIGLVGEATFREQYARNSELTWQDGHLFREGCMNEFDLQDILDDWADRGLRLTDEVDGCKCWKDVCVVFSHHGPSYPCDWIEYDAQRNIVWQKGLGPGSIVGPPLG